MKYHLTRWVGILLVALIVLLPCLRPAHAQEGGLDEPFDSLPGEGWEFGPDVSVEEGALRLPPGNFAMRAGSWDQFSLEMRLQFSGPGVLLIHYAFRDGDHYILQITDEGLSLNRVSGGEAGLLAEAPGGAMTPGSWLDLAISVSGGQHTITVNGSPAITASDPAPLPPGGLLIVSDGERYTSLDSLRLTPAAAGERLPDGGEPAPAGGAAPAAEPPAAVETTPTGQAAQGGWLDSLFDIRASNLDLLTVLINLALASISAYVLSRVYIHWGTSLSNRRKFAANFMLITVTTTFIILVVRSSIALSLGLVGALSIVRFRTAIKEPEELAYLFFAIGLGIGYGDNQRLITVVAMAAGIVLIGLARLFRRRDADTNLHVTVTSYAPHKVDLEAIMQALQPHTSALRLVRLNENGEVLEAAFLAEFRSMKRLSGAREALGRLAPQIEIAFLDNQGIW